MDGVYAFKLGKEYQDFSGGSVVCSAAGHMLDVKAALDAGDGLIPTSDPALIAVLRSYPALEEVDVPEDRKDKLSLVSAPAAPVENQATTQPPWIPQQPTNAPVVEGPTEIPAEHQPNPDDPTVDPTGGAGSGDAPSDEPSSQASSSSSPSRARSRTGQTPGDNQ